MSKREAVTPSHPLGGEMVDIVRGLITRLQLPWLLKHHQQREVLAFFSGLNGCISVALIAVVAVVTREPLVFPSLGPTAFLCFYKPLAASSAPHNIILGHAIGVVAGYLSLVVTGLTLAGPATATGMTWPRVIAAGLAMFLTPAVMVLAGAPHPPAAATTLIIALGIITRPWQLGVLMLGVALLAAQAILINRLAGLDFPLWKKTGRPSP